MGMSHSAYPSESALLYVPNRVFFSLSPCCCLAVAASVMPPTYGHLIEADLL